jgi:hypothetical protein
VHVQLSTQRAFLSLGGQRYTFQVISFWPGKAGGTPTEPPANPHSTSPGAPGNVPGQSQSHCLEQAREAIGAEFSEHGQLGSEGPYPDDPPGFEDAYATCMRKGGN